MRQQPEWTWTFLLFYSNSKLRVGTPVMTCQINLSVVSLVAKRRGGGKKKRNGRKRVIADRNVNLASGVESIKKRQAEPNHSPSVSARPLLLFFFPHAWPVCICLFARLSGCLLVHEPPPPLVDEGPDARPRLSRIATHRGVMRDVQHTGST